MSAAAPVPQNNTVYVRNLEERIKIDQLKETLQWIFEEYGNITQIVAKTSLKAKGQAFVVFENADSAKRAVEEVNGFDLFEKPMVVALARAKSDITVLKEGGEEQLEEYRKQRQAEKERRQAEEAAEAQRRLKRPAPTATPEVAGLAARPAKTSRGAGLKPTSAAAAPTVPDEFLPPNKILFLRDIPESMDHDALTALFAQFPGFQEVRTVPGRKGIAFVEYDTDVRATTAKEATSQMPVGDHGRFIRVTYQRQ